MIENFFTFLNRIDSFFWGYIAFGMIILMGSYLTISSGFFQVRNLFEAAKDFFKLCRQKGSEQERGVSPIKTFFASTGGMIGVGNIAGIVTAVQLGGPGALFWVWVAGLVGAIVKYGEIYLGFKYRVKNQNGSYDGGPMYFLRRAFKGSFLPLTVAFLLCIYGVDVYQFSVLTTSISKNWGVDFYLVITLLLGAILWAALGGVSRVGKICTYIMPLFILTFMVMAAWVIFQESGSLLPTLKQVFISAFTGHSAIGGFVGSSVIFTIQHGLARAAYSADLGVGYDSIIQSESNVKDPVRQAKLAILGVFLDNFICTLSILVVLLTGVWKGINPVEGSLLVQTALEEYFPLMNLFMPFFLIIAGYSTLIAFFCVGLKCARYLMPRYGAPIYLVYGSVNYILFSFLAEGYALVIMSIAGAMLLIINMLGIFRLRKEISFEQMNPSQEAMLFTE